MLDQESLKAVENCLKVVQNKRVVNYVWRNESLNCNSNPFDQVSTASLEVACYFLHINKAILQLSPSVKNFQVSVKIVA